MRKITKLMLALVLCVVGAGMNSVKAEKVYGSLSVATGATWNSETNTMGFTAVNGWQILLTGLPSGDITAYMTIHATLSNFSENLDKVRLRIKDKSEKYADYNLVAGENNVNLVALRNANPNCDFTNIKDITIWSPTAAKNGSTIDDKHPASVVITDVYIDESFVVISNDGFTDEITSLDYITNGNTFVISDNGTKAMYFANGQNSINGGVQTIPNTAYFTYLLEKVEDSGIEGNNIYRIRIKNLNGTDYSGIDGGCYINTPTWGITFAGISANSQSNGKTYGQDDNNYGLWYVTFDSENGFSFQNVGKATDGQGRASWMKVDGMNSDQVYLKLYKSIEFSSVTVNPANDKIFALSKATGYDAETKLLSIGGWTFDTPVDLSNWNYLVITTSQSASNTSSKIHLTDDNGVSCTDADNTHDDSFRGMVLDKWNNRNALCIDLNYLKTTKGLDITKIKSLTLDGYYGGNANVYLSQVYLTSYLSTNMLGGQYVSQHNGNLVRNYTVTGKFGTISLPYKASVSGALVYSIAGKTDNGITLERVDGLLEAGKSYFYMSYDEIGSYDDNKPTVGNVHFFRADFSECDITTPVLNNGLVGTFTNTTAPQGENYYVLSKNELYQVDSDVTVEANKAYVDLSKITNSSSSAKSRVSIDFEGGQATGIAAIENNDAVNAITNAAIYNLNGQRVMNPTRGIYIVNGKKLFIK